MAAIVTTTGPLSITTANIEKVDKMDMMLVTVSMTISCGPFYSSDKGSISSL